MRIAVSVARACSFFCSCRRFSFSACFYFWSCSRFSLRFRSFRFYASSCRISSSSVPLLSKPVFSKCDTSIIWFLSSFLADFSDLCLTCFSLYSRSISICSLVTVFEAAVDKLRWRFTASHGLCVISVADKAMLSLVDAQLACSAFFWSSKDRSFLLAMYRRYYKPDLGVPREMISRLSSKLLERPQLIISLHSVPICKVLYYFCN